MSKQKPSSKPQGIYTAMLLTTMQTDAWQALSPVSQALFPWLRLEWRGAKFNNNGKLCLSYREAAKAMGISKPDTIGRAFKDLQAKGFVVVHKTASLGIEGNGYSFEYEITDLEMPGKKTATKQFVDWKPGQDFPIAKVKPANPDGKNGKKTKQIPIPRKGTDPSPEKGHNGGSYPLSEDTPSRQTGQSGQQNASSCPAKQDILSSLPRSADVAPPSAANSKGQREGVRGIPTIDHDTLEEIPDGFEFVSIAQAAHSIAAHLRGQCGVDATTVESTSPKQKASEDFRRLASQPRQLSQRLHRSSEKAA